MRPFADLLREYTSRTGVSDAELARALGVRRQTIFRWKEGLTERPRHRQDVVRCAEKLRLTVDERDELLLAAGFPPERREPVGAPSRAVGAGELKIEESGVPTGNAPAPAIGPAAPVLHSKGRLTALAVLVGLVAALAVGALVLTGAGLDGPYPTAAPGELLVLLGSVDAPSASPTTADQATGALGTAIERELRAARVERVRVAVWPNALENETEVTRARQRAGATLAVGGTRTGSTIRVVLSLVEAPRRSDDLAVQALVGDPAEASFTLAADSPDEAQALGTLVASHALLQRSDTDRARALLSRVLAAPPRSPDAVAFVQLFAGYAAQLPPGEDPARAAELYASSAAGAETWLARLNRGVALIRLDQPQPWQAEISRAAEMEPERAVVRRALCWGFVLDRRPMEALPHCDAAVRLEPEGRAREARAAAYAGLGRHADAAADMDRFAAWLRTQPRSLQDRYGAQPSEWLRALREGRNPVDEPTLEAIRRG